MKEINIYFGRLTKDGQMIEEAQFMEFLQIFFNPHFENYTLFPVLGMYKGSKEPATMIQILITNEDLDNGKRDNIREVCNKYNELWLQECTLVTYKDVIESHLYGRE